MSTPSAGQIEKTGTLYNGIIESVIKNVREPFYDEGLDDQVIQELRELWICKLKESGVLSTNPTPVRMPQQIQQQRVEEQNYPGHPAQRPRLDYVESQNTKSMQFAQRMQQMKQQNLPQKQTQNYNQQNNLINSQSSQYINQSSSIQPQHQQLNQLPNQQNQHQQNQHQQNQHQPNSYNTFHHVDGHMNLSESESDQKSSSSSSSESEEEDNDDKKSTSSESAKSSTGDVEEIALNSGDDIEEDDSVSFDNVKNTIYCQYEHVKRKQAAKWTIKLNNGVMNLDGKDYSFSKCHGEADW